MQRTQIGNVIKNKMNKTVVVELTRRIQHPLYKRVVKRLTRLKAHDEKNACRVGDRVRIVETRPLSKDKHWKVIQIVEKAKVLEEELGVSSEDGTSDL